MDATRMTLFGRLYRGCITLMPAEHRRLYGDEQWRLFEQVVAEEAPRETVRRIAWSCGLLARGCWAAMQAHLDKHRSTGRERRHVWTTRGGGNSMGSDCRFTLRSVKASPWYAVAVIAVTAVTLALATTTFAIVDGVLFRPLPYPDAGALVSIAPDFASVPPPVYRDRATFSGYSASEVDFRNWQAAVPEVTMTAFQGQSWSGLSAGDPEAITGVALVQANFFEVIGVSPMIGGFTADDFLAEAKLRPVILTYANWMARSDGGRNPLGQEIITDPVGRSGFRIVGVMPKGFTFPSGRSDNAFITPYVSDSKRRTNPTVRRLSEVIARLPSGMSSAELTERLMNGVTATAAVFPVRGPKPEAWSDNAWRREGPYDSVSVSPLASSMGRQFRPLFLAVFAAVALLVVIAASNVASLMSARALERQREIEVRRALGAGVWAVARLWTIEAAALIAIGGASGALVTPLLMGVMLRLLPDTVVLLKPPQLDWRVAGFVVLTISLLVLLVAIAPIRRSLVLSDNHNRGASERVRTPGRFLVIGSQVGVAFVLTVVGACLVGSLMTVYSKEQPIQVDGVVTVDMFFQGPESGGVSPGRAVREQHLRSRLAQLPDVISVGATAAQVLKGGGALPEFNAPAGRKHLVNQDAWAVTEGFYDVIAPQLVEGRLPTREELRTSAPLLVVSERVAQNFWPDRLALGQTLVHWPTKASFTVIGVVKDVRWLAWDLESPIIYAPYATVSRYPWLTYFIRTNGNTARMAADATKALVEADALVLPRRTGTLASIFRDSVSLRRFQSWLFGGFAAAALVVVGVGILGLLAMSTARRTKEVGIRCALGATPNSVATLVVREQAVAVIAGLVVGGAVAAWAVKFVKGYLYELTVTDPRIWLSAVGLILLTALVGALVPAWRASRIDPLKALRVE
jgi:predicted permease